MLLKLIQVLIYFPFINLLSFFIWLVPGHNAAWGIILLTLAIRFVLLVPSKKAAQAQRKLAQMQPLIEDLKAEYGDDREGLAKAQMDLYKQNDINPFASCGLSLIQLPILYVLYFTILHGLEPHNPALYSWIPQAPVINTHFLGIDLLHPDRYFILPIIAGILQFIQMRMVQPPTPKNAENADPSVAMQRNMMYFMPLLTVFIAYRLPAGAPLYWVATTLFSVVQQYFVNKERLKLTGLTKAVETAAVAHPEHAREAKKAKEDAAKLETPETKTKNGVSVTVRKKSK